MDGSKQHNKKWAVGDRGAKKVSVGRCRGISQVPDGLGEVP